MIKRAVTYLGNVIISMYLRTCTSYPVCATHTPYTHARKHAHMHTHTHTHTHIHPHPHPHPHTHTHTFIGILHPVQHDLRSSIPSCCYISCHFLLLCTSQTKVQDSQLTALIHCNVAGFEILGFQILRGLKVVYVCVHACVFVHANTLILRMYTHSRLHSTLTL